MRACLWCWVLATLLLAGGCERVLPSAGLSPSLRKTSAFKDSEVSIARRSLHALDEILAGQGPSTLRREVIGIERFRNPDRNELRPDLERWVIRRGDGAAFPYLIKLRPGAGPLVFAEHDSAVVRQNLSPGELRDLEASPWSGRIRSP